jgi:hypothetical protein
MEKFQQWRRGDRIKGENMMQENWGQVSRIPESDTEAKGSRIT